MTKVSPLVAGPAFLLDLLRSFARNGVTDDTAAFAAFAPGYYGKHVDMAGYTYAASALPYDFSVNANVPIYANGKVRVSGVDYPMHSVGGIISGVDDTQYQHTGHRAAIIAADRVRARGNGTAALASSRVDINGAQGAGVASLATEIRSAFGGSAFSTRYCEVSGERSSVQGSTLCRIYGLNGLTDYLGRYDLPQKPFDALYPNAALTDNAAEQFSTAIIASTAVDVTSGSNNFVAASRGEYNSGGTAWQVTARAKVAGTRLAVLGSQSFNVAGDGVLVGGSFGAIVDVGVAYSGMVGTRDSHLYPSADESGIIGSNAALLRSARSIIAAASSVEISDTAGTVNAIIASAGTGGSRLTNAANARSVIIASRNVENIRSDCLVIGTTSAALTPNGTNQNQKIRLEGDTGVARATGGTATTGFDYAELMENLVAGVVIPAGTVVVREGRKVRPGRADDPASIIQGVISRTASVIGNSTIEWQGKYQRDEWGGIVWQDFDMVRWPALKNDDGDMTRPDFDGRVEYATDIPDDAEFYSQRDMALNPDYDASLPFALREERPADWSIVGYLGQIRVRMTAPFAAEDFVAADGSVSAVATGITVVDVDRQFEPDTGYGIAWCYVSIR